ncbi:MAG: rod shape-determining protein MreC [Gemmatimonadales bacterium]
MRANGGRSLSRSDTLLLGVCLALSVTALLLPSRWALAFADGVRGTALAPLVWLQKNAEEQRTSRLRLRAITAARDSVALAAQSLAALQAENEQLRGLLALKARTSYPTIPAEVLHQTAVTDGRTLLLGAGTRAGVQPGSPVVSPEGLVGLVISADGQSSIAMTWAHPDFAVSAITADGSVLGLVAPAPSGSASEAFLELRGVPYRDTVAVGTLVLTSGLPGVYPKGIPIGRVAGVRREELGWERVYRVGPLVNPGRVTHVLVYRVGSGPSGGPS